jgi:preprotein translocase subunit SecA
MGKFNAVIEQIVEANKKGQPVLVGTISIEKSELLSKMLKKRGIKHNVLNAKQHEKEAEIIAQAGKLGAVTIATNMAGRGTDITLGGNAEYLAKASMRKQGIEDELIAEATGFAETDDEDILEARKIFSELNEKYSEEIKEEADKVREAGGLFIIGTERHESRRIDNQLRGRAGRQGDPGKSRFFLSTEDDLMRLFGGDRMKAMLSRMNVDEDMPIENKMLTNIIENSQEKVELRNFGIRKDVLQYDDVLNKQREIIYTQRDQVLDGENIHDSIIKMIDEHVEASVNHFLPDDIRDNWNIHSLIDTYYDWAITDRDKYKFSAEDLENIEPDEIKEMISEDAKEIYAENEKLLPEETIREMERVYLLRSVDTHWMDHIDNMEQLKAGIHLRSYGQHDPVVEYRLEGFDMFDEMIASIHEDTIKLMLTQPKRIYEQQKRREAIAAAKRLAAQKAAYERLGSENEDEAAVEEQSDVVKNALKRKKVAEPTATSGDGTDTVNKTIRKGKKIGRNDPCPCGSGKKYKKCCGRNE